MPSTVLVYVCDVRFGSPLYVTCEPTPSDTPPPLQAALHVCDMRYPPMMTPLVCAVLRAHLCCARCVTL